MLCTDHAAHRARERLNLQPDQVAVVLNALWEHGQEATDGDYPGAYRRPGTVGRVVFFRGQSWVIVRSALTGNVITVLPRS